MRRSMRTLYFIIVSGKGGNREETWEGEATRPLGESPHDAGTLKIQSGDVCTKRKWGEKETRRVGPEQDRKSGSRKSSKGTGDLERSGSQTKKTTKSKQRQKKGRPDP